MTGNRSFLTWKIHDAIYRMMSTPSPHLKVYWAGIANKARRERGDFAHIADIKREQLDKAGERTDE